MGSCASKQKSLSSSLNSNLRRQVSSIIMSQEEAEKVQNEEQNSKNTQILKGFRSAKLPSQGKAFQGTLLFKHQKIVLTGLKAQGKQMGFEDKRMSISNSEFSMDQISKFGISVTCKKGLKPDCPNQDDYFVSIEKDIIVLGVFDGHGQFGHDISNFIHSTLPGLLMNHPDLSSDPVSALKSVFRECQSQLLCNTQNIDCTASGSTATLLCCVNKKLFVAHIGDSRAVIAQNLNGTILAKNLTQDHRPDLESEAERIKQTGGEIRRLKEDAPYRIFRQGENFPGLNMSRAFGDTISQQLGVISDPDILEVTVQDCDLFILLCSDGIWEFISSQEAVNLVNKCDGDAKRATENLAALAWMRWKKEYDGLVDDITVILLHLTNNSIKEYFTITHH